MTPRRHATAPASAGLLVRAAMFGAAIGGRSSVLFAAPVLARRVASGARGGVSAPGVVATIGAAAALGGELVADKLPATPSRHDPPVLTGRAVTALVGAVVLARRERSRALLPMIAAALAAVAEVLLGVRWRSFTQKRGRAAAGAVVEDVVVVVLAMVACWPRPRGLARGKRHRRRS